MKSQSNIMRKTNSKMKNTYHIHVCEHKYVRVRKKESKMKNI